jgi:lipoic acid synthetase
LGETRDEVVAVLADLAGIGVDIVTVGQYLRPSARHLPVERWWRPEDFDELAAIGRSLGLGHVEASPLTRSSYHAKQAAKGAESVPVAIAGLSGSSHGPGA